VFNDGTYSLIEKKQEDAGMIPHYIKFTNPDFDLLAKSFHCDYYYVDRAEDFEESYIKAGRENGIKIIEVKL
jgi:acetolactate synthase-1/2/3 large subunit